MRKMLLLLNIKYWILRLLTIEYCSMKVLIDKISLNVTSVYTYVYVYMHVYIMYTCNV